MENLMSDNQSRQKNTPISDAFMNSSQQIRPTIHHQTGVRCNSICHTFVYDHLMMKSSTKTLIKDEQCKRSQ